jgi:nucleoside 2-deoxyribosyltransferase
MKRIITVCGSMDFSHDMTTLGKELERMGYTVMLPADEDQGSNGHAKCTIEDFAAQKRHFVDEHLEKIKNSDAILIANFEKRGITGYIGANTLVEIAFAYAFHKPIFVLHPLGEQPCKSEVLGMQSANLNGELINLNEL